MKKQLLVLALFLASIVTFAQKAELKAATKAISKSNFREALTALNKVESLQSNLDNKSKAKFLFLKSQALNGSGSLVKAAKVINELLAFEDKIGKAKYTSKVKPVLVSLIKNLSDRGIKEYQSKNFSLAKVTLEQVYNLSKKDTAFLYYTANAAYLDKDLDLALAKFTALKEMGYTGIKTLYSAKSIASGNVDSFDTEADMNKMVKLKAYENPKIEVTKSNAATVIKNIAFIYVEKGDNKKAVEAIQTAREADPKDANLIITEANIELKLGNNKRFGELMKQAIKLKPNDANLHYNVGVINQQAGKIEEAKAAYRKAIALDSEYASAYLNLGLAMLEKDKGLVEEMNANLNDFDKYDQIKARQLDLYREVLPIFEKAHSLGNDMDTMRTLMNLYENLEMYDKLKKVKAIYEGMKK